MTSKTLLTHLATAAALVVAGGQALAQGASGTAPGNSMSAPSQHGQKAPSDRMSSPSDATSSRTDSSSPPADRAAPPSPSTTAPGAAGTSPQAGRVAVDVSALRSDLAKELNIDEDKVPATVTLPPGQAAQACGKSASELVPTTSTSMATCSAEEATSDLRDALRSEIGNAGQPGQ